MRPRSGERGWTACVSKTDREKGLWCDVRAGGIDRVDLDYRWKYDEDSGSQGAEPEVSQSPVSVLRVGGRCGYPRRLDRNVLASARRRDAPRLRGPQDVRVRMRVRMVMCLVNQPPPCRRVPRSSGRTSIYLVVVVSVVVEQVQAWRHQETDVECRQARPSNPASPPDRTQHAANRRVPLFDKLPTHRWPLLPPFAAGENAAASRGATGHELSAKAPWRRNESTCCIDALVCRYRKDVHDIFAIDEREGIMTVQRRNILWSAVVAAAVGATYSSASANPLDAVRKAITKLAPTKPQPVQPNAGANSVAPATTTAPGAGQSSSVAGGPGSFPNTNSAKPITRIDPHREIMGFQLGMPPEQVLSVARTAGIPLNVSETGFGMVGNTRNSMAFASGEGTTGSEKNSFRFFFSPSPMPIELIGMARSATYSQGTGPSAKQSDGGASQEVW
jgi:hypothetical protein